jgi:hypothetical protein
MRFSGVGIAPTLLDHGLNPLEVLSKLPGFTSVTTTGSFFHEGDAISLHAVKVG